MPRSQPLTPSFNAGEISPRLWSRLDFVKYPFALEKGENAYVLGEGGVTRRPGTRYVAEVSDSSVKHRLKRFRFNVQQAYILEMGDQSLRFYRHQGQIVAPATDAAISNGTFDSDITGWDDQSTGGGNNQISHDATNDRLTLETDGTAADDIAWAEQDVTTTDTAQEHVIKFRVIGDPGDKIEFQVGTASTGAQTLGPAVKEVGYHCVAFTPTTSPFYVQFRNLGANADKDVQIDDVSIIDNAAIEIDTPWVEADLFEVEGPQTADVLYLFHDTYPTHKLQRFGHTTWSLVEVAWQDGPYLDINDTTTSMTPSATDGRAITVTASATTGINEDPGISGGKGFKSTDVGRLIRIDNDASPISWGWGIIIAFTSTTQVTVDVKKAFATTNADTRWHLGAWSATTGYPQTASFFEQRLYCGATKIQSQTFWFSQTADFENHKPDNDAGTQEDDDAGSFTLSADDVNAIRWMSAGRDELAIGTDGGIWIPISDGIVVTPNDITVHRQTTRGGCAKIQPIRVSDVVVYVQRAKRKVREFIYTIESDGYKAPDLTRLAQHITCGQEGIVEMDFAEERESIVWALRCDGVLLSLTYRREEDVVGWMKHYLGGAFDSGHAVVDSVAVIPGADGAGQVQSSFDRDEVWIIGKRTINGATKRCVEVMERAYEDETDDQEDSYYVDSCITYDGAAATAISGLDHLEGETVRILADGAIVANKTVSSGAITLDTAASVVQIGLGYTHKIKPLKIVSGNQAGTTLGKKQRIYGVIFSLLESHTLTFGRDADNTNNIDFRTVTTSMDAATPLFTGEWFADFSGDWSRDARIYIESDDPVPFTLLAMAPEIAINPLK